MKTQKLLLLILTLFFFKPIQAQVAFQAFEITSSAFSILEPQSVFSADIDGDGDLDVLCASQGDDKIGWYENTDGNGLFSTLRLISSEMLRTTYVTAADMDSDGDMDVISSSYEGDFVAWHENLDGKGTFGELQTIATGLNQAREVYPQDLDGDNDLDIFVVSSNGLHWIEHLNGQGEFAEKIKISTTVDLLTDAYPGDFDGDGDIDILGGSGFTNKIYWYENTDGNANFGSSQTISFAGSNFMRLFVSDLDNDNDMDFIIGGADNETLSWFENTDGQGNFGEQQIIGTNLGYIRAVYSEDIDKDDDLDIVFASANFTGSLSWFQNTDGQGNFGNEKVISSSIIQLRAVQLADLDDDNDLDVFIAGETNNEVAWFKNNGFGSFGQELTISSNPTNEPRNAQTADLDSDGDLDVIFTSSDPKKIGWFENLDGQGKFSDAITIATATNLNSSINISIADLDGDGDVDIASANRDFDEVAWYQNEAGVFSAKKVIYSGSDGYAEISIADIDNDGDLDIISIADLDHKIAWFENLDGQGNFASLNVVPITVFLPNKPVPADLDGDGDIDILTTATNQGLIIWYENTDGQGSFSSEKYIESEDRGFNLISSFDMDSDGDMDVIANAFIEGYISWYENMGQGIFGEEQVISSDLNYPGSFNLADVDGDNDLDIINAVTFDDKINWIEHIDGQGNFETTRNIVEGLDGPRSISPADIDNDGDIDFLAIGFAKNQILWFENLLINISSTDDRPNHDDLSIFPNPSSSTIEIQFKEELISEINIYTLEGKLVKVSQSTLIDVSGLNDGIYILEAKTFSGKRAISKLAKNNE